MALTPALASGFTLILFAGLVSSSAQPLTQDPLRVTICHKPGTRAEKTLTLSHLGVEDHIQHGDTRGICPPNTIEDLLPFLQNSNLVQVDTGKLLEAIEAGQAVELPCAAPGGQLAILESHLTARDLRAPGSGLPFLNTYEVVMDATGRAGVFSITEEDFRSWVTDSELGECNAEPIGPLLRLSGVPESEVERILAVANTIVYNGADLFQSVDLTGDVFFPPESDGPDIARSSGPMSRFLGVPSPPAAVVQQVRIDVGQQWRQRLALRDAVWRGSVRPVGSTAVYTPEVSDGLTRGPGRILKVRHRTGDGGDTTAFGVLFMGYVADINFQNGVATAYNVSGSARDTKVREILGWWNQMYYDTLHWYEPAAARGGHNRYNIIPVIGSIELCGVAAAAVGVFPADFALNCPHTVQHVNMAVTMVKTGGAGRSNQDGLACGHSGSIVNGQALTCTSDTNHVGISFGLQANGTPVPDAGYRFIIGHEVGHVLGCEPTGAPGESGNHTDATVTFDGVAGESFMKSFGNWGTFRPLYTDACDVVIAGRVNSRIPPPRTD